MDPLGESSSINCPMNIVLFYNFFPFINDFRHLSSPLSSRYQNVAIIFLFRKSNAIYSSITEHLAHVFSNVFGHFHNPNWLRQTVSINLHIICQKLLLIRGVFWSKCTSSRMLTQWTPVQNLVTRSFAGARRKTVENTFLLFHTLLNRLRT